MGNYCLQFWYMQSIFQSCGLVSVRVAATLALMSFLLVAMLRCTYAVGTQRLPLAMAIHLCQFYTNLIINAISLITISPALIGPT